MRIWVTKYALTRGIIEAKTEIRNVYQTRQQQGVLFRDGARTGYAYGENRQWCRTKEAAIEVAERMQARKLKSLQKQMNKTRKLVFK